MLVARLAFLLCLCGLPAASSESSEDALTAGDECLEEHGGSCALSALQIRGGRLESTSGQEEQVDDDAEDDEIEYDAELDGHAGSGPNMLDKINKKLSGFVAQINKALPQKLKQMDPLNMNYHKSKVYINQLLGLSSMSVESIKATKLGMKGTEVLIDMTIDAKWSSDLSLCGSIGRHRSLLNQWGGQEGYYDGEYSDPSMGYDYGYSPQYGNQMPSSGPSNGMMPSQPGGMPNYNPSGGMMPPQANGMMPNGDPSSGMMPPMPGGMTPQTPSCPSDRKSVSLDLSGVSYQNQNVTAFVDMMSMTITRFQVGAGKVTIRDARTQLHLGWLMKRIVSKKIKKKMPQVKAQIGRQIAAKLDSQIKVMLKKKCPIPLGKKKGKKKKKHSGSIAEPVHEASASGKAACSAAPACAKLGLAGDCCPNAAGVRLGCCV